MRIIVKILRTLCTEEYPNEIGHFDDGEMCLKTKNICLLFLECPTLGYCTVQFIISFRHDIRTCCQ